MDAEKHQAVEEDDKEGRAEHLAEILEDGSLAAVKVTVIVAVDPIDREGRQHQDQERNEEQISIFLLHPVVSRGPHQRHNHKHQKMVEQRALDHKAEEGVIADMVIENQPHDAPVVNDRRHAGKARPVQIPFFFGKGDDRNQNPE